MNQEGKKDIASARWVSTITRPVNGRSTQSYIKVKSTEKLAEIKTNQVRKVYILIICFLNTETSIGARSGLPGDVINGDVTSDTSSLHRLDDDLETEHDVPNDSPLTQESSDYGTIFEQTQKEPK